MKLLTITIPCYNSQEYLERCLNSLLPGNEDVEILIVDDGSTDDTGAIADEYSVRYPATVRVIHQKNGGHGDAINTGIMSATGLYFKVLDSDDWVDYESYMKILGTLRNLCNAGCMLDMLITNFVYERGENASNKVMRYTRQLPANQLFDWSQTRNFNIGKYILMHSVIYRTQILRDCHLSLPKHSFYVDNLFVFLPLPYVDLMYYMDLDFYHYNVSRRDQSSSEQSLINNIDQHVRINKIMFDSYDFNKILNLPLRHYMLSYLEVTTVISTAMLIKSGTKENLDKKRELWTYFKENNLWLFHYLRRRITGQTLNLPGRGGKRHVIPVYKISQKVIRY